MRRRGSCLARKKKGRRPMSEPEQSPEKPDTSSKIETEPTRQSGPAGSAVRRSAETAERLAQWEERDDIRVRKEAQKAASRFRKQEPSALRGLVALWETAPLWKEGRHNIWIFGGIVSTFHIWTTIF